MKKNNGISIITLIITIVIIIILAGVTLYYGFNKNVDKTASTMVYNEIFEVSEAVSQRTLMNRMNPDKYNYVGTPLTDSSSETINNISYGEGWYKLIAKQTEDLGMENVKGNYIVNYKTGEVISIAPISYEDEEYYSSNDIRNVIGGGNQIASSDMYDAVKGVNKPYLVTGMIPVRNVNNQWIVTNADDDRWYDYSAENKSWANIMLTDEITVEGYTNEEIRNVSLAELEGKKVTSIGSMFVWIPRYTSNSAGEVMYSNLYEDYTEDGFTLSNAFTDGTKQLTGIWVSKYDADLN